MQAEASPPPPAAASHTPGGADQRPASAAAGAALIAAASHNIRQPFQAMRLFLHLLEGRLTDPAVAPILIRLTQAVEAGEGQVDALMALAALEAGTVEPVPVALDPAPLLTRLGEEMAVQAAAKGIRLRVRVQETARGEPRTIPADPALLERALRSLLANAIRHTDRGGVLLALRGRGAGVEIQVWDTGSGIPPDRLADVFRPYERIPPAPGSGAATVPGGLGLGLTIVRRLADLAGWTVSARSIPGRGSVFALRIGATGERLSTGPAPMVTRGGRHGGASTSSSAGLVGTVVAVVEDDRLQLAALDAMLREWGAIPVPAGHPAELTAALERQGLVPGLLVTDYRLPGGIPGTSVAATLRDRLGRTIPGLLLTGDSHPETQEAAREAGLTLVRKPVHPLHLRRALETALAGGDANGQKSRPLVRR
jgi:CheY-like chemotaxis protein/anti-sigma regulatory factor (Ser/Thr protein kinase)